MDFAKKILTILLLLVLVAYSGGVSISKHLCKGKIVTRAFNSEAKVCKRAKKQTVFSDVTSVSKPSCCDNEHDFFKSFTFEKNTPFKPLVLAAAEISFPCISIPVITSTSSRVDYYEPPPGRLPTYLKIECLLI